jgi:hypothetical protein
VLTVNYQHRGEARTACLEVTKNGRLRQVSCDKRRRRKAGLGTAIKAATTAVGIKPCGGCQRRAAQLDEIPVDWLKHVWEKIRYPFRRGT